MLLTAAVFSALRSNLKMSRLFLHTAALQKDFDIYNKEFNTGYILFTPFNALYAIICAHNYVVRVV
jgi:hypothetical protein